IGDNFVGKKSIVTVDRPVVLIVGIGGIITPGWVPPSVIPAPEAQIDENDRRAMLAPPIAIVVMMMVVIVTMTGLGPSGSSALPIAQAVLCRTIEARAIGRIIPRPIPFVR